MPDLTGFLKWNRLFGQSDPSASIQINPDSTISPINALGSPETGGVYWDSAVAGRIRVGAGLKHKSGTDAIPGFTIGLMTDSNLHSANGYGFRIQENTGADVIELLRITSNGTSSPGFTSLASATRELSAGDTLLFDHYPDGRMTGIVRGAGGSIDSLSAVDTTYQSSSWKAWLSGAVFPDSLKMDDFIIWTIPYTIVASAAGGGSISPSGTVDADSGGARSFTITPDAGYHIDSVVVDGIDQGTGASYNFTNVTANHSIAAYFSINVYTITATVSAGGSISPSGPINANYGANQAFTITPNTGYHIDSVVVDGVNQGAVSSYNFMTITANHTIDAYCSINVYTISATASAGGSISPSGSVGVNHGADQLFTITPNTGYHVDSVRADGVNLGAITSHTFTSVTAGHTIAAYFSINVYTITATASSGGSILPFGAVSINYGADRFFTITPNTGSHIDSVVVDGTNQGAVSSYNFTTVTSDHTITAYFSIDVFTITATAGPGGSISPSGTVGVNYGANKSFGITPNTGYHIDSVVVDGAGVGAITSYDFINVTGNHAIGAFFSIDVKTITATADAGGSISPSGTVNVNYGSDRSFSITPDTGYHIDSVVVDGVSEGAITSRNFTNVTANHTIGAYFSINVYTITASAAAGGSISPSGTVNVNYGASQLFTVTPNTGYHIDSVVVDGANEGAIASRNFTNVAANHSIAAYFSIDVFTISATAATGGSISPSGSVNVNYGAAQAFAITPNTGYHIDSVVVDGANEGAIASRNFTNVTANHSIAAYFSIDVFTISATAATGGSISPSGSVNVNYGAAQAFAITPNTGYHLDSVVVDGLNQGAVTSYNFTGVTSAHSIDAHFSIDIMTITASASAGGSITPSGAVSLPYGSSQSFTMLAETGLHLDSVMVDGVSQGAVTPYNFTNVTANHTIAAYFSIDVFTVTVSSVGGGSVSPAGAVSVNYGDNQQFVVTPDQGYHTDSVVVDGIHQGNGVDYLLSNVTANHTFTAYFSIDVFTVAATASAGGSITPSGAVGVDYGADRPFSIVPDTGYHIDSVVVDGVNQGAVGSYTLTNVTADHAIGAFFSINVYTITPAASAGGSISPSGAVNVNHGETIQFTITPVSGYHTDSVVVDGVNLNIVTVYTFSNVTANHSISAYFSINVLTIAASATAGGTISPTGSVPLTYGSGQAFSVTPDTGHHIDSIVVDNVNQGALTSYTFSGVTSSHTIRAYFSINAYTITATASAGGRINPAGSLGVTHGGSLSFAIIPNASNHIDSVVVDGVNLGVITAHNFANVTAGHSIAAWFSPTYFTVTSTADSGGAISPQGAVQVLEGADQEFTISPSVGYLILDVLVDSVSVGSVSSYTLDAVTGPHTIHAKFLKSSYVIAASASPGGTISPAGNIGVQYGGDTTFVMAPAAGYHLDSLRVDGVTVGAPLNYTFTNITASHTIGAFFSINRYTITASSGANGSITPSGTTTVVHGANQNYTFTPSTGYVVQDVRVDGVSVGALPLYGFTNVTANHTIQVTFTIQKFTITATAGPNGSMSPAGVSQVNYGGSLTVFITPNSGYYILGVVVDSTPVGVVGGYAFNNVTSDHTITATFTSNAPPTEPQLLSPINNAILSVGGLNSAYFSWTPSSDADPGDVLNYVLTITGPSVNFSTFEHSSTNISLDLSGLAIIPDSIYRWTVRVTDGQINVASPDTFRFTVSTTTAAGDPYGTPREYALGQNYPNPFNPSTSIPFDLPERSEVTLKIYTTLGEQVMSPGGVRSLSAGSYLEPVDFAGLPSGTYIYRLTARGESGSIFVKAKKLVIIR